MVLVRVGQDQEVDPPIPGRQPGVERQQEPIRVRSAVDQQPPAPSALDQDRVALADVEDRDPDPAVGSVRRSDHDRDEAQGQDQREDAREARPDERTRSPVVRPSPPAAGAGPRTSA